MKPTGPTTPASVGAKKSQLVWTLALAASAAALIWGLLSLAGRVAEPEPDPNREIAAEILGRFNQGLPREFAPGLMLERVHFEGTNLVMILRSEKRDIEAVMRDTAAASAVRVAELEQLRLLCGNRDVVTLLAGGASLTRRFLSRDGTHIFDVTLAPTDCARPR